MSLFEGAVGLVIAFMSMAMAYLAYRRGTRADKAAQENTVVTTYDTLLQRMKADNDELRNRIQSSEQERDKKLMGTVSLVQAKADNDYVVALEARLDRCWGRIDKAEKDFADCKEEMDKKIKALEARLSPGGPPA